MIKIVISDMLGSRAYAAGALLGTKHFDLAKNKIRDSIESSDEISVLLDFDKVEFATPSYLKTMLLSLYNCSRLFTQSLTYEEAKEANSELEPFPLIPILENASEDVEDAVNEVFGRRGVAIFSAVRIDEGKVASARLLGKLDPAIKDTLQFCSEYGETTAGDLAKNLPAVGIRPSGWSNRLAELHRLRLLSRRKAGRSLVYTSLTEEIIDGVNISC